MFSAGNRHVHPGRHHAVLHRHRTAAPAGDASRVAAGERRLHDAVAARWHWDRLLSEHYRDVLERPERFGGPGSGAVQVCFDLVEEAG